MIRPALAMLTGVFLLSTQSALAIDPTPDPLTPVPSPTETATATPSPTSAGLAETPTSTPVATATAPIADITGPELIVKGKTSRRVRSYPIRVRGTVQDPSGVAAVFCSAQPSKKLMQAKLKGEKWSIKIKRLRLKKTGALLQIWATDSIGNQSNPVEVVLRPATNCPNGICLR